MIRFRTLGLGFRGIRGGGEGMECCKAGVGSGWRRR